MLRKRRLKLKTSVLWSLKLACLTMAFLITTACGSFRAKKDREIWLIDNDQLVLYRVLDEYTEAQIDLSHKTATQFMCISRTEFDKVIEDLVREND